MKAKFITIEGCDGSGKSTQKRLLLQYLKSRNIEAVDTREPGGTPEAEKIRELILDTSLSKMSGVTELLLYTASRVEHVQGLILPSLKAGKFVVCDRFIDSTLAYQGYARGLGVDFVKAIFELTTPNCWPDATIFLDVSPHIAFLRKGGRDARDRMENEALSFHQKVYQGFLNLKEQYKDRIISIDASGEKEQTSALIIKALMDRGVF
ncbi:MAG: dTMP kinase [Clostridiales bacterium]|jgi:dTMP kinase|nr:dTMP kinase [Clostridiales bacterium]